MSARVQEHARYRRALLLWAVSLGSVYVALLLGAGAHVIVALPGALLLLGGWHATTPERGPIQWALLLSLTLSMGGLFALTQWPHPGWGALALSGLAGAAVAGAAHGVRLTGRRSFWGWAPLPLFGLPLFAALGGLAGSSEATLGCLMLWKVGVLVAFWRLWSHPGDLLGAG